jgi:glycerol dehydrogenase
VGITDDEWMRAAEAARADGETIHNEPTPIDREVLSALKAADGEGKRSKSPGGGRFST